MKTLPESFRRSFLLIVLGFLTVAAHAQTWTLTNSIVVRDTPYPVSFTTDGLSHGTNVTIYAKPQASGSWVGFGGGGGPPGNSSVTASGTIGFSVAGTWLIKAVNGNLATDATLSEITRDVSAATTPTTFSFSNLYYTYDGTAKTANVTPNPWYATYTINDLTKGPEPGVYTVTTQGTGVFTGSGSATLVINPSVATPPPPGQPPPPAITPSSGTATLVGTLSGSVSVDNKGSANYSIPLQVPPGRSGLQPNVSLNYSSAGGNGPLGIGFSLSTGFPQSITRGRSILARDGETRGVTYTATDKFYLDGKRLICTSGTYGSANSTYRTEVDSFVTIMATGSGTNIDTFIVTDKSGTKMTFGKYLATADAYQSGIVRNAGVESVDNLAYAWALKRVEDTVGNSVNYTYETFYDGEYELKQISYTDGPGITAQASVNFIYDRYYVPGNATDVAARKDIITRYEGLRRIQTKRRLDRIEGQMTIAGTPTVVSAYDLLYKYSAADKVTTRLNSIQPQFLDSTSNTLLSTPATALSWNETLPSYNTVASPANAVPRGQWGNTFGFGDVDGDGRDDFIDWGGMSVQVSLSNGSGFNAPATWLTLPAGNYSYAEVKLGDFNGDGLKDLIAMPGNGNIYAAVSNGTQFVPLDGIIHPVSGPLTYIFNFTTEFSDPIGGGNFFAILEERSVYSRISVADFTGDGLDDILIHRYDGKLQLIKNLGGSFQKMPLADVGADILQAQPNWQFWSHRFLGFVITNNFSVTMTPCDLNGDGITDYSWTETHLDTGNWQTTFGSGTSLASQTQVWAVTSLPSGGFSPKTMVYQYGWIGGTDNGYTPYRQPNFTVVPGDVNGDGLTDFTVLIPAEQEDASMYGTWGAGSGQDQRILRRQVLLSEGSSGAPRFKTVGTETSQEPRVNVNGTMVLPSWDWIAIGEWVNDRFNSAAQINTSAQLGLLLSACKNPSGGNVTMCDVNHDGRQDYVWYVDLGVSPNTGWWVTYSLGETFATPQKAPLGWFPTRHFDPGQLQQNLSSRMGMDLNGDGVQDYTNYIGYSTAAPGISGLHISSGQPGLRLGSVTNGLGQTTSIAYKPLTDDKVYTKGAAVSYPIRELRNATYVVSDVWQDSGVNGQPAQFSYQYSGNRLDLSGRGSLGFHSFVTLDQQTGLFKYQFLAQSFPMTGLTHREETYRWWNTGGRDYFRFISSHDNTVVFDKVVNPVNSAAWGTLWPFISQAIEYRWEDALVSHFDFSAAAANSQSEKLFSAANRSTVIVSAHITISAESHFDGATSTQLNLPGVSGYNPSDLSGTTNSVSGTTNGNPTVAGSTFYGLPGNITQGNLTELKTLYPDNYGQKVATSYYGPTTNGLTGLVKDVQTFAWGGGYGTVTIPAAAPKKTYTYWSNGATPTPLVWTEFVDATTAKDSDGNAGDATLSLTTTYTRDTHGRVTDTQVTSSDPTIGTYSVSSVPTPTTNFDDRWDLPKVVQNNYGHTTTTVYHDFLGKPISVKDANGAETKTTYDALGRTVKVRNELTGIETTNTFTLDTTQPVSGPVVPNTATLFNGVAAGWETQPQPAPVVGIALTSAYRVTTATTVAPTTTAYYDRLGRVIRTIKDGFNSQQSQQIVTDTAYNNLGQTIATSLPYLSGGTALWTKTAYDRLGRVKEVYAPNGTVTINTYAGRTTRVVVTPAIGQAQINSTYVDAKGRTVKVWNTNNDPGTPTDFAAGPSAAPSITFTLDGFGRMRATTLLGQASQPITAKYDALGRQIQLSDPDKGVWNYRNNALGQVVWQKDANLTETSSTFDHLGRPLNRTTGSEVADFYYYDSGDLTNKPHTVDKGTKGWIGAPEREEGNVGNPDATINLHYYDDKGRPSLELAQTDGKWFYTYSDYDAYSRIRQVRHYWKPSGADLPDQQPYLWQDFGYTYTYDGPNGGIDPLSKSYLISLTDSLGRSWWDNPVYDYMDRVTSVRKGSHFTTTRDYRAEDGVLTGISTTDGLNNIQSLGFIFDGLGNLTKRTDSNASGGTEDLVYDNLNRLTSSKQGATSYLPNGNILAKDGVDGAVAITEYDSAHPHAVKTYTYKALQTFTVTYDANGNLTSRNAAAAGVIPANYTTVQWCGFDKPRWMAKTSSALTSTPQSAVGSEFHYNAGRSRVMQLEFSEAKDTGPTKYNRKRIYALGSTLELNYTTLTPALNPVWDLKKVRIYVPGPDGIIGSREFDVTSGTTGTEKAIVYHYDHIGSIVATTDFSSANITKDGTNKAGKFSEDAWGLRRDPVTWIGLPTTTDDGGSDSVTPRGYTGHEMLDDLGLVHMNGRIYDPLLGRFLSPDKYVDGVMNLQGYNRYSYVKNNPLTMTDPSGDFGIFGAAIGAAIGGAIGGGVAWYQGKSGAEIAAAAAGGAVAGALVGSGAGLIAAAINTGALSGGAAIVTSAVVSAGGNAAGNYVGQVGTNLAHGESFSKSATNIDGGSVAKSALVGAAVGVVGGASMVVSNLVRVETAAIQSQMSANITNYSTQLIAEGAPAATVQQVQNSITQGMAQIGSTTAQNVGAVGTVGNGGLMAMANEVIGDASSLGDAALNNATPPSSQSTQTNTSTDAQQISQPSSAAADEERQKEEQQRKEEELRRRGNAI